MYISDRIQLIKSILVVVAVLIAVSSLGISHSLTCDLAVEETNKVETWAEALKALNNADENVDLTLVLKVLTSNNTIPVIAVDNEGNIQTYRNVKFHQKDSVSAIHELLSSFKIKGRKVRINLDSPEDVNQSESVPDSDYIDVYFDDSLMLKRLATYPYVQLGVVLVFVLVAIFALLSVKRSEQDKVWIGLSKETAHQLGTPTSSLMAWVEILQSTYPDDKLIPEMNNDVRRLQMITERFSKIGSLPELQACDLIQVINQALDYMIHRTSNKVQFVKNYSSSSIFVKLNPSLFSWVIENLCKNAIDAMDGKGIIRLTIEEQGEKVFLDISDTGKGIQKSRYHAIFRPGYTTKRRGWGLGLTLVKRIVEEYHKGKIYVKYSELNKGTVFRIELKR